MDTQLKKNIFARLFPAMAEPQTADDAAYSDPDREAPSTPTTRRFEMPQQAYSAPMTSENPEEMTPAPTETASDPGGSTLSRLGSYIGNDGIGSQMPKPDPRQQSLAKVNDVYKKKFGEMQSETLGGMMQDPATPSPEIDGDGPVNYGYGREMDPEPQSNLARLAAAATALRDARAGRSRNARRRPLRPAGGPCSGFGPARPAAGSPGFRPPGRPEAGSQRTRRGGPARRPRIRGWRAGSRARRDPGARAPRLHLARAGAAAQGQLPRRQLYVHDGVLVCR